MRASHRPTPALGTPPAAGAGPRLSLGLPPVGRRSSPLSGSVCRGGSWAGGPGSVRGTPCRRCARTALLPARRTSCKGTKVNGPQTATQGEECRYAQQRNWVPSKLSFPRLASAPCSGNPGWPQPHSRGVPQSAQGLAKAQAGAARVKKIRVGKAVGAASGSPQPCTCIFLESPC